MTIKAVAYQIAAAHLTVVSGRVQAGCGPQSLRTSAQAPQEALLAAEKSLARDGETGRCQAPGTLAGERIGKRSPAITRRPTAIR